MRRLARAFVAASIVGALASAAPARASGFPDFDPKRETILWGRVRPGEKPVETAASERGKWEREAGRLRAGPAEGDRSRFWIPKGERAHLGDGLVRMRVEPVGKLDLALMARLLYDDKRPDDLSGYEITLGDDGVRFHRWDRGSVLPMGPEHKLPRLGKRKSLEIVLVLVGPQMIATIHDGEDLSRLATLQIHDTTYAFGCVGVRAGAKQDPGGAVTLLSAMDAAKHASKRRGPPKGKLYGVGAGTDTTPFGNTRFAFVAADRVRDLPKPLRGRVTETLADERGDKRAVLALDTVELERLRRTDVPILAVDSNVPWMVFDEPYRRRRGKPPTRTARGFKLDESYKDPRMVDDLLRGWHERYPEITQLREIGRSHQGRPILALRISDRATTDEDEPAVLLDAAHHGSELLAIEYALDAAATLVEGYRRDPAITKLVDELEIWCVPMVNPDGNAMFIEVTRFNARKNARDSNGDGESDPFEGVDLNRNYPFGWGETGSSGVVTNRAYRGPAPASEPETHAMVELANSERFAAVMSFHTFGTVVFTPYVVPTLPDLEPDVPMRVAAKIVADAPEQPEDKGRYVAKREGHYPVAGSDQDWHLHAHGSLAYVLEGSHHNPPLPVRNAAVEATRPVWVALLDHVRTGPWVSGHVRDELGKPLEAEVWIEEIARRSGERWTSRPRDGRFDRFVPGPGKYRMHVRKDGYDEVARDVTVKKGHALVDVVLRRKR